MKVNEKGLYFKIDENLKREFNIECIKNKTTMSEVIKKHMREYIEKNKNS